MAQSSYDFYIQNKLYLCQMSKEDAYSNPYANEVGISTSSIYWMAFRSCYF